MKNNEPEQRGQLVDRAHGLEGDVVLPPDDSESIQLDRFGENRWPTLKAKKSRTILISVAWKARLCCCCSGAVARQWLVEERRSSGEKEEAEKGAEPPGCLTAQARRTAGSRVAMGGARWNEQTSVKSDETAEIVVEKSDNSEENNKNIKNRSIVLLRWEVHDRLRDVKRSKSIRRVQKMNDPLRSYGRSKINSGLPYPKRTSSGACVCVAADTVVTVGSTTTAAGSFSTVSLLAMQSLRLDRVDDHVGAAVSVNVVALVFRSEALEVRARRLLRVALVARRAGGGGGGACNSAIHSDL
ncbi:hypothetical protein PRIPAC_94273 [Pristionchus pacificus]|uniref:Uncharacterized protein n=1 Tax=Pristionchus pacificus TaxID=54126 RepID=A0A2A6BIR3_PRIPA|nr:hypothetical protein PRIPAC_94273 [Pristionchus pacificus]|eukprot:PDM65716.1 hypothetical protein PRIPAC_45630 [Pristionchus pacificus]